MTANLGDIIRQLRQVLDELDQAAATTKRAQAEIERAQTHLTEATRGTDDREANRTVQESRTAAEKAGKSARLFAEAATAFAKYLNHIIPGSTPARSSTSDALPSGEQLVRTTGTQGPLSSRLLGRMVSVPNADDGLQHAGTIAENIQDAAGSGAVTMPRSHEPAFTAAQTPHATAGDALLAAFTLATLGIKGSEVATRLRNKVSADRRPEKKEGDSDG